jgi:cell wall-associated NlpC family hydrolase
VKRYLGLTVLAFSFLGILAGCAPKKVHVYNSMSGARGDVVELALGLHGKPYRSGAKGPDAFDCSGFVHFVYKKVGVSLPVSTDGLLKAGQPVGRSALAPADLVFFKLKKDLHIGIMVGTDEFIHASKSRGVVVDSLGTAYWQSRLSAFRSLF